MYFIFCVKVGDIVKIENFDLNHNVFIVAELSANHGGDINVAKETIKAAYEAGADAVKLQTYTADTLTIDVDNEYFRLDRGTIWDGRTLYDLYLEAFTPWEWHKELKDYAESLGLIFFSTPFDKTATDFLDELGVGVFKVASFEILDLPLIEYIASFQKTMIISTGIASLSDIDAAVETCRKVGNNNIILLKCTSSYPAKVEDANLATIPNMKETFGVEVGLSDHTMGITVPAVSVALGARVIEKHIILNKEIGGPDSSFSLSIDEFKEMVKAVRDAEKAIGRVDYSMSEEKRSNRTTGRSLFVVQDIKAGEVFTNDNVRSIRPGYGMHPKYLNSLINKKAKVDLLKGTPLDWNVID